MKMSSMEGTRSTVRVVAVSTILLWVTFASSYQWAHAVKLQDIWDCPPPFTYVYPYGAHCSVPARFFTDTFQLYDARSRGGLEPEWDETNSTYYMRLAPTSASYTVLYNTTAASVEVENVYQNFPTFLQNAESTRYLAWREEGDDEYFLIETDSLDDAATFWFFAAVPPVSLPCILLPGTQCEAYNLLSLPLRTQPQPVAGWLLSEESGVNYIKLASPGSRGEVPILLERVRSTFAAASTSLN